jgi:hypothetical protein
LRVAAAATLFQALAETVKAFMFTDAAIFARLHHGGLKGRALRCLALLGRSAPGTGAAASSLGAALVWALVLAVNADTQEHTASHPLPPLPAASPPLPTCSSATAAWTWPPVCGPALLNGWPVRTALKAGRLGSSTPTQVETLHAFVGA